MVFPGNPTRDFPNLTSGNSRERSLESQDYNCIAWAASDTAKPWWPDDDGYWPEGANIPREVTLPAFIAAFQSIGYVVCDSGDLEMGVEKIAIYTSATGPTHAARQLSTGKWTSKLGLDVDIEHDSVSDVAGGLYGTVACFLKRKRSVA